MAKTRLGYEQELSPVGCLSEWLPDMVRLYPAASSKTYTGGLVAELAETVAKAVAEADEVKADKPVSAALTITTADWYASGIKDYPYAWDFTVNGLTENDIVTVAVAPKSQSTAAECGLCAANTSSENTLTLYAVSVPTSEITSEYYINQGSVNE